MMEFVKIVTPIVSKAVVVRAHMKYVVDVEVEEVEEVEVVEGAVTTDILAAYPSTFYVLIFSSSY